MKTEKRKKTASLSGIEIVDGERTLIYRLSSPVVLEVAGKVMAGLAVGIVYRKRPEKVPCKEFFIMSCRSREKRSGAIQRFQKESTDKEILNWLDYELK